MLRPSLPGPKKLASASLLLLPRPLPAAGYLPLPIQQPINRPDQLMPIRPQLIDPLPRHFLQHPLPARQQRHDHIPPVIPRSRPPDIPIPLQPIHQLHHTVMFQREPVRQGPDCRCHPVRQPANHQQKEILLRLQPRPPRRAISFAQKLPNLVPQFRQRPILFCLNLAAHPPSISYCDTLSRAVQILDSNPSTPGKIDRGYHNGLKRRGLRGDSRAPPPPPRLFRTLSRSHSRSPRTSASLRYLSPSTIRTGQQFPKTPLTTRNLCAIMSLSKHCVCTKSPKPNK